MAFETVEFDLSMVNPDTGRYLTGRVYTVDGIENVDGSLRELSIGQLVMAICLTRAAELEESIIALMEEMNSTSAMLESLTEAEQGVVDYYAASPTQHAYKLADHTIVEGSAAGMNYRTFLQGLGVIGSDIQWVRDDKKYSDGDILFDDFISSLEAKMDERNSFSQQKMIELQSQTSKRDQTYDMISNILKSLNTVLVGNANNM